jgi:hypothetical protein
LIGVDLLTTDALVVNFFFHTLSPTPSENNALVSLIDLSNQTIDYRNHHECSPSSSRNFKTLDESGFQLNAPTACGNQELLVPSVV